MTMDAIEIIAWTMVVGGPVGFVVGLLLIVPPMEREWQELMRDVDEQREREKYGPLV